MNLNASVEFLDLEPKNADILIEVLYGLSKSHKTIPAKFLYDKNGSEIFEKICELAEYYPTRAEKEIFKTYASSMTKLIGQDVLIIEPGSGSAEKVKYLLNEIHPLGYVPMEISKEILMRTTVELHEEYPDLNVLPVCADFTQELDLPLSADGMRGKKIVFFPGSTIGNFHPTEAIDFLRNIGKLMGHEGGLLIGADLKKDSNTLTRAYDDSSGVTAAFNLNLLERLNRELGASFDVKNFEHKAFYNEELGRVEMHLRSKLAQLIKVNQTVFRFREGETIHTENSYKYTTEEFCELCAKAHLEVKATWKDSENLFCVYYFEKQK